MRVVSYNIQFGRGLDGLVDLVRPCRAVRGADIICLQEVDQYWRRSGDSDQPAEISGLLPSYYAVYGSSFDVDASAPAAHGAVTNRRRRHGNMILSHWPILSMRTLNLPKQHYADKFNMHMTCLEAVIDTAVIHSHLAIDVDRFGLASLHVNEPETFLQELETAGVSHLIIVHGLELTRSGGVGPVPPTLNLQRLEHLSLSAQVFLWDTTEGALLWTGFVQGMESIHPTFGRDQILETAVRFASDLAAVLR